MFLFSRLNILKINYKCKYQINLFKYNILYIINIRFFITAYNVYFHSK